MTFDKLNEQESLELEHEEIAPDISGSAENILSRLNDILIESDEAEDEINGENGKEQDSAGFEEPEAVDSEAEEPESGEPETAEPAALPHDLPEDEDGDFWDISDGEEPFEHASEPEKPAEAKKFVIDFGGDEQSDRQEQEPPEAESAQKLEHMPPEKSRYYVAPNKINPLGAVGYYLLFTALVLPVCFLNAYVFELAARNVYVYLLLGAASILAVFKASKAAFVFSKITSRLGGIILSLVAWVPLMYAKWAMILTVSELAAAVEGDVLSTFGGFLPALGDRAFDFARVFGEFSSFYSTVILAEGSMAIKAAAVLEILLVLYWLARSSRRCEEPYDVKTHRWLKPYLLPKRLVYLNSGDLEDIKKGLEEGDISLLLIRPIEPRTSVVHFSTVTLLKSGKKNSGYIQIDSQHTSSRAELVKESNIFISTVVPPIFVGVENCNTLEEYFDY